MSYKSWWGGKKRRSRQKYEYAVRYEGQLEWPGVRDTRPLSESTLNKMAAEGWELVSLTSDGSVGYFRRELTK